MSDDDTGVRRRALRFARRASIGASGLIWLILLYALSLGAAFIILSGTVFQSAIITGKTDEAADVLFALRAIPERENHLNEQIEDLAEGITRSLADIQRHRTELQRADAQMDAAFGRLVEATAALNSQLGTLLPTCDAAKDRYTAVTDYVAQARAVAERHTSGQGEEAGLAQAVIKEADLVQAGVALMQKTQEFITSEEGKIDQAEQDIREMRNARRKIRAKVYQNMEFSSETKAAVS
jgi:chromosome segregation ATPase